MEAHGFGIDLLNGTLKTPFKTFRSIMTLLLIFLCFVTVQGRRTRTNNSECPEECFCNLDSQIVYCSRRGLTALPRALPPGTLQLNANGNLFEVSLIERSNLTTLTSLEHLYVSECGIERIEIGAFQDLTNLKWLDLSNNRISRIEGTTFMGLSLMHLFLSGNRNLRLGASSFADMHTTGLYLQECSLSKLSFDVFEPLNGTLQFLWLDANEIETVDKKFLRLFASLLHLRLGQNPLNCNCESLWLKELYDTTGRVFDGAEVPSCLLPARLRSKKFNEISLFDFTCISPVFKNIDAVLEQDRGLLTCRAYGDPAPTLYWIAPTGISTKYTPQREQDKYNEAVMDITHHIKKGHDFSGQYFCVAINEAGNMTFTFNVSWPAYALPVTSSSSQATSPQTTVSTPKIAIDGILHVDNNQDNVDLEISDLYRIREPPDGDDSQSNMAERSDDSSIFKNNAQQKSNHTVTQKHMKNTRGMFTLVELIGAIVGTFACTLILCFIVIPIVLKRTWHRKRHKSIEKPPFKEEPVYMAPVDNCNHYTGKLSHPYSGYSQKYYFDNSSAVIGR